MASSEESNSATIPLQAGEGGAGATPVAGRSAEGTNTQQVIADKVRERLFSAEPTAERIGRFLVLEQIGRGGMGLVYAAYDEELDRKVAIKILLEDEFTDEEDQRRFQREAQALARLSHPHVVTVHEVGQSDGRFFLAMEYIRGESMKAWLKSRPDRWAVLEAFVQAGRGLMAAHLEGLVHRDLKPANIMRSDDGVVKVLDFGLARATTDGESESSSLHAPTGSNSTLSSQLTQTGSVMGTPAYMAPEQFQVAAVDARSDQYGFCVAVWEGLTGTRPFPQSDFEQQFAAKLAGPPPWPDDAPAVPRTIVDALRRGLAVEPDERWPSMRPLLEVLSRDPTQRRNRWLLGGAGVLVFGLGGLTLKTWGDAAPERCTGAREQLAGVWDDARRGEVEGSLSSIGKGFVDGVSTRTVRELDLYADGWTAMHTEACEATTVRGEQSSRVLDLRMGCLRRAAVDLRATVDTLASADEEVAQHAHELTSGLPELSRCADLEALTADVEPPRPEEADAVEAIRRALAHAGSEELAGRYQPALEAVEEARAAREGVEYGPVQTELVLREGSVLEKLGRYDEAEAALVRALELAMQWNQRDDTVAAARLLMDVVGIELQRMDEALRYWPLVKGLSRDDPRNEARAHGIFGRILSAQGKYEQSEVEHRAALVLLTEHFGPDDFAVAAAHSNIGRVLTDQGDYVGAEAEHRQAVALSERVLGPEHPIVASARNHLGVALDQQDKFEDAEREYRAAIEVQSRALGPDHAKIAGLRNNLALVLQSQGRHDAAEEQLRATQTLIIRQLGPEHPKVGYTHINIGAALATQLRYEEAEVEFRAAVELLSKALEPGHPLTITARNNRASSLNALGRHEEAEAEHRAVLAIRREALGPEHPEVATSLHNIANALAGQGRYEESDREYRAAIELWSKALGPDHSATLDARRNLAHSFLDRGRNVEAEVEFRELLARREAASGPDHRRTIQLRVDLALVLLRLGRASEGLPLIERAWAQRKGEGIPAGAQAETAFVLAQFLWAIERPHRDRARAIEMAEESVRRYESASEAYEDDLEKARQWLKEHR
ncbi:MAG: serine/threonine-protein kinase [Myxococcota bacterium]